MNPDDGIILVTGGTGRSGIHIVRELLGKGFQVRLISRTRRSVETQLGDLVNQLENVIECDLALECKVQKTKLEKGQEVRSVLELAFEPGRNNKKVQAVVSALGVNLSTNDDSYLIEVTAVQLLCQLAVKKDVKKFVLVSSCLITRPFNFVTVLINAVARNCLALKVKSENIIRESGLEYIIVRPGHLVGDGKDTRTTEYEIAQGDQRSGKITRATVGKLLVEALENKDLPKKVTFECFGSNAQQKQPYNTFTHEGIVDDSQLVIPKEVNHGAAKNLYRFSILSTVVAVASYFLLPYFKN